MKSSAHLFKKYIDTYAETEAQALAADELFTMEKCDYSLVIPLHQELQQIPALLNSIEQAAVHAHKKIALIMVFNQREDASAECKNENKQSLDFMISRLRKCGSLNTRPFDSAQGDEAYKHSNELQAYDDESTIPSSSRESEASREISFLAHPSLICGSISPSLFVIIVDRCSSGLEFNNKEGVGLARKIGCDLASVLFMREFVRESWIFNSDADASLAIDYFVMEKGTAKLAALLYPFQHQTSPDLSSEQRHALTLYDQYLHYYVRGLSFAGSPYAFATLGSTIAVTVFAYIAVRGFPKRLAGEDFYFLNKIAKVADLRQKKGLPIILQGRLSNRVPFGTGPAIQEIAKALTNGETYKVYHPHSFRILKFWLESCELLFKGKIDTWSMAAGLIENPELSHEDKQLFIRICQTWLDSNGGPIFVENIAFRYRLTHNPNKHFHVWFDAFKTMKFIHFIRENFLPPMDFLNVCKDVISQKCDMICI